MRRLEIEWRHLDQEGKTCDRCMDTGEEVRKACEILSGELAPSGWTVSLTETLLTYQEVPESNSIYLNGVPIEDLLPNTNKSENCCDSCCEILGAPTLCRTLERSGNTYEAIPAALILEAARRFIQIQTEQRNSIMEIKVLGPGCAKCQQTEKIVKEAVAEAGVSADVEKVSDLMKIAGYGVFGTPAVIVNGEVKCVGKVPTRQEVISWLTH